MISERLNKVILNQLKLKEFHIQDETVAYEVPGWDSLSHIKVILAIEKEYGIRFKTAELLQLKNVGDLQIFIDNKITNKNQ
jgi:acyl carrier protein